MSVFEFLALKGARIILAELSEKGKVRYSDLVRVVGHSTTTSRALNLMKKLGYVRREVLQEKYRPVVYSLTDKGRELANIMKTLIKLEEKE